MDLSVKTFDALNKRFGDKTIQWLKEEKHAQLNRLEDPTLMDIYDTATEKGTAKDTAGFINPPYSNGYL
jgi:hypothetical protein